MRNPCPEERLRLLADDQLPSEQLEEMLHHLEDCSSCQGELETLTADVTWWQRASDRLADVPVDDQCVPPAQPPSFCCVEPFLEPVAAGESGEQDGTESLGHLQSGVQIDEFDVEEKIGQGGMGVVFRGYDRSLKRAVAIKVMSPHLGANLAARRRFAREAQAAAAVTHPHVVPIYRVNASDERPYIVMALIEGSSLQECVSTHGPLSTAETVRLAMQIAGGLAAAHHQGLIHRDIKPANVLVDGDIDDVMITDFGLARAVDDVAMTQSGCLAGTPHYMSPEQVTGGEADERSDLFSLGSVMYFMATGREPFQAESAFGVISCIARDVPADACQVNPDVPRTLSRIIARLLEKDPARRCQSALELQELLRQYHDHLRDPQFHVEPHVRPTPRQRRQTVRWFGRVLVVLLVAVAVWLARFVFPPGPGGNGLFPGQHEANSHDGERHESKEHMGEEHREHSDHRSHESDSAR